MSRPSLDSQADTPGGARLMGWRFAPSGEFMHPA